MKKTIHSTIAAMLLGVAGQACADLDNGLVAAFTFSGNANDSSGNNYIASVFGAQLTNDRFGNSSSAYLFESGDMIQTNVGGSQFANEMSYSLWIKSDVSYSNEPVISNWSQSGGHSFAIGNSYNYIDDDSDSRFSVELTDDSWHHVVVTYTNTATKVYVDGISFASFEPSGSFFFEGDQFRFGQYSSSSSDYFRGVIDDVYIYNRELSGDEAYQLYSGSSLPTNRDCRATYSGGSLNIPCVDLSNGAGGTISFDVDMDLLPSMSPLTFQLSDYEVN